MKCLVSNSFFNEIKVSKSIITSMEFIQVDMFRSILTKVGLHWGDAQQTKHPVASGNTAFVIDPQFV